MNSGDPLEKDDGLPGEAAESSRMGDEAESKPVAAGAESESTGGAEAGHPADAAESADEVAAATGADEAVEGEDDGAEEEEQYQGPVEPLEEVPSGPTGDELEFRWYILKVQVNREDSIRDALLRRVARDGMEHYFGEIIIPTEDVVEFTKSGKKRTVKRKLFPGYIMVNMALNDDSWFLVRETPGIGDFTGSAGKPTPMDPDEVRRIVKTKEVEGEEAEEVRIAIPFNVGDRVRVKEGYFQNFEGDVESIDSTNGRVTVMINIFGRSTPVELQHWQMERV